MIVDDSNMVRVLTKSVLEKAGYEVVEAEHGLDALEKLGKEMVDLMIVDLNMPKMDGLELISRLRSEEKYKKIPIIVFTTETSEKMKEEALSRGANDYITKPPHPLKLIAAIANLVANMEE